MPLPRGQAESEPEPEPQFVPLPRGQAEPEPEPERIGTPRALRLQCHHGQRRCARLSRRRDTGQFDEELHRPAAEVGQTAWRRCFWTGRWREAVEFLLVASEAMCFGSPIRGFKVLKWRWIVERTFGWLGRNRRLSKDYEESVASSMAWVRIALIGLLVRRLGAPANL